MREHRTPHSHHRDRLAAQVMCALISAENGTATWENGGARAALVRRAYLIVDDFLGADGLAEPAPEPSDEEKAEQRERTNAAVRAMFGPKRRR